MFLNLFGTVFHIRLPLKHRAGVPYLEVLVSGNFNNCLLRRSYRVFFKSKNQLNYLLTCIFQLTTHVCYFHEHSTSYSFNIRSSKFASSISYSRGRVRLCILFIWLFVYFVYLIVCVFCLFDCLCILFIWLFVYFVYLIVWSFITEHPDQRADII